jgi:hypothetical protein
MHWLVKVNWSSATGRLQPAITPEPGDDTQVANDDPTPATATCTATVPGTLLGVVA